MTIEQLNERIAQLTELVKTGSEAIKNMEAALKAAEEERDRIADQQPKFERVKRKEEYYYIDLGGHGNFVKVSDIEDDHPVDKARCDNNNYFYTEERAQEVADKINFLLRLERLHDTFCPDYVPDWNNNEWKYSVFYDNSKDYKGYKVDCSVTFECKTDVYFATAEIAQKVCDILNTELKEKSNKS